MEQQLNQLIQDLDSAPIKANKGGYHYRYTQGPICNVLVLLRDNLFSGSRRYYMTDLDTGLSAVTDDPRAALAFLRKYVS